VVVGRWGSVNCGFAREKEKAVQEFVRSIAHAENVSTVESEFNCGISHEKV
jgi:hypothetical protein